MASGKSKFKILWKYQKKEEPRPFSRGEIWTKLYGEFHVPSPHEADSHKKETVFNPRDKIFSERKGEPLQHIQHHPMAEKWRRVNYIFRRYFRRVLGFAPIFILAFLALFLLFRKSSDVSVLTTPKSQVLDVSKNKPQSGKASYTIQVCLYEREPQAAQLAKDLQTKGWDAYVYEAV